MCHPEPGFEEGQAMQPLPRLASEAETFLGQPGVDTEAKWAGRLKPFRFWAVHSMDRP